MAKRLISFAIDSVGHIRGGLAMASVMACMLFAAVSGSSPATVAAIGTIVIAGMVRSGYPESFAAGVIANAGTLGILIPPSIVMLVYAAATEVSASRMFMAGFIPGLMMGGILMLAIYIAARIMKLPSEKFPGFGALAKSFFIALGGLMLIFIVLGSIYGGIASPTEAAAVAAVYAYLVSVMGYRDIGPMKGIAWRNEGKRWYGPLAVTVCRCCGRCLSQFAILMCVRLLWMPPRFPDAAFHHCQCDAVRPCTDH